MEASVSVYDEIKAEREAQDTKLGTNPDDEYDVGHWVDPLFEKINVAEDADRDADYRRCLIEIAAIAAAAVESLDRCTARMAGA